MAVPTPPKRDMVTLGILALAVILLIANLAYMASIAGDLGSKIAALDSKQTALSKQVSEFTGRGRGVVVQGRYAVLSHKNATGSSLAAWDISAAGVLKVLMAPAMGANRWEYWIKPGDGYGTKGSIAADDTHEYIVYVLNETATLTLPWGTESLTKGSAVFINQTTTWSLKATSKFTVFYVAKKAYDATMSTVKQNYYSVKEADAAWGAFTDKRPQRVKSLTPAGYDLRLLVLQAKPTGGTGIIEHHIEEHGVILIGGEGVYLLGNTQYPMKGDSVEGDFVWVGPYTVHEFTNTATATNATYLLTRG